jgi:hypothetical protein
MPTVFRQDGFRFFFYSHEGSEPPHIHVIGKGGEAKIWLRPVMISKTYNLSLRDHKRILEIVRINVKLFLEKYEEWHELDS